MANDDDTQAQATPVASGAPGEQTTAGVPKGVVLDKDGKPCRSCTSFSSWKTASQQIKNSTKAPSATGASTTTRGPPAGCPPDVEVLGRSTWTLLHSIAANYPETATRSQQSDLLGFVGLFSKLYPCWVCADDFRGYIGREQPRVGGREEFGQWLCGAHNEVNRKLGKPVFDCAKWDERWRTGPKDGRCD